ncbi:MAG: SapC family protein [Alphaproteobacteria bacterium]
MVQQNTDPAASLPLFYSKVRPLDRVQDATLCAHTTPNFKFAVKSNAIPLVNEEFQYAAGDYPIVFANGSIPVPVAVTGLELDKNLMLDAPGNWLPRSYIPAYVRRFPFILVEEPNSKQLVLCYEEGTPHLSQHGELKLFEKDEPTDVVKRALDFCMALRQQGEATDTFVQALLERKLLDPGHVEVELSNGRMTKMDGFLAIDREKFRNLPTDVLTAWHKNGWLDLIYAHFLSGSRWQKLAEIAA